MCGQLCSRPVQTRPLLVRSDHFMTLYNVDIMILGRRVLAEMEFISQ